jgi:hypothetical protein
MHTCWEQSNRAEDEQGLADHLVIVIVALPLLPSLVAVMVTTPSFFGFTTPDWVTIAMLLALVSHRMGRPVRTLPAASFGVAVNVMVLPFGIVAVGGVTATLATGAGAGGAVTVTLAVPVLPSLVAVIVAVPAETPVTTPVDDTVALELLDVHVTTRPVSKLPPASRVVAVSVVVPPT